MPCRTNIKEIKKIKKIKARYIVEVVKRGRFGVCKAVASLEVSCRVYI